MVVGGAGTNGLHCAARIEQRHGQQIAVRAEAVLQDESLKTARGEPVRDLAAFEVSGETSVGSAWQNDHRGTIRMPGLRIEDGERGNVFAGCALGLGRGAGPEANGADAEKGVVLAGSGTGLLL